MKTRLRLRLVPALLLLLVVSVMAQAPATSRVQVNWAPNDQLSEVKQNPSHRGYMEPAQWQKALGDYLRRRAERLLPAGQRLIVTIDDIKLAGDYEPWRGAGMQDVRILKDLYPPRMNLHFRLTDASGKTLREGSAKLRDLAYLQRGLPNDNDPLRYDKRMIGNWLGAEFGSGG